MDKPSVTLSTEISSWVVSCASVFPKKVFSSRLLVQEPSFRAVEVNSNREKLLVVKVMVPASLVLSRSSEPLSVI